MSTKTRRRGAADDTLGDAEEAITYDTIMGRGILGTTGPEKGTTATNTDAATSLSTRLVSFRSWLNKEAMVKVHSAVCVVNGEATDGTRNAPVLVFGPPPDGSAGSNNTASGRVGIVDGEADLALYDRTMGCQLRTVREIKKDEIILTVPRGAFITPDLVACSDAGKAVLACCQAPPGDEIGFWDAFENTTICEEKVSAKVPRNNAPQTLVRILQERKKAESAFQKHCEDSSSVYTLAEPQTISTLAPLYAFLIHQRFSNRERPPVSEHNFYEVKVSGDGNALGRASDILTPPDSPETFAPYARTLPSSVSLPLCWKRSELALLTACLAGHEVLQNIASSTLRLASEFMTLLNAGMLKRFPEVFPEGVITWDRWVWAASMVSSRILPASLYLDKDVEAENFKPSDPLEFQSPPHAWKEIGVMVPLLDMLNHEIDACQVTWEPCIPSTGMSSEYDTLDSENKKPEPHPPRASAHKKIRKGSELFMNYGLRDNGYLISQYGFALMNNASEQVRIGLGLADAVGNASPPHDHTPSYEVSSDFVFESNDEKAIAAWWTEDRTNFLKQEALSAVEDSVLQHLVSGRKLALSASNDGSFNPILLTVVAIATMPPDCIQKNLAQKQGSKITLSTRHQLILRRYLEFLFSRKLEKLLQILDNGLKVHFDGINLWVKSSEGGLDYHEEPDDGDAGTVQYTGWQSFFDSRAYRTAMEVEKHYYAMGSDSCVLTLYDGQLRALQTSLTNVSSYDGKLSDVLVQQLTDLGFDFADDERDTDSEQTTKDVTSDMPLESTKESSSKNGRDSNGGRSPRHRKRNKKNKTNPGGQHGRPPALKLHVGNLSYKTTPSDLYDYFCSLYGETNILECHIPTERESGRSRGFGFVAMPEEVALKVLRSGNKHEVGGRVVKIARSNSVGSGTTSTSRPVEPPVAPTVNDRCPNCGYSPKYCTCRGPRMPPAPGYDPPPAGPYGPAASSLEREVGRSLRSYEHRGSHDMMYDRYGRYDDYHYDRDGRSHREDSSRSYERSDADRRVRRETEQSHDGRSRSASHRWDYEEGRSNRRDRRSDGSGDRDRKRSRSRSRERGRKKKSKRRARSPGRSPGSV